jgi:hypothetical protein
MAGSRAVAAARRGLARYVSNLRASQEFLAAGVSRGGWLDLGQFRWHNLAGWRAVRAVAVTVMDPIPIVTMEVRRPELPEQRRPFEVVITAPRTDGASHWCRARCRLKSSAAGLRIRRWRR